MSEQNISPAARYREILEARRKEDPTYPVKCRSGMVFDCRLPDVKMYFASGRLPEFYQNQAAIQRAAQTIETFEEKINNDPELQQKIMDNALFVRDLVLKHVESPRIVEKNATSFEVNYDDLLPEDFEDLTQWLLRGGDSAETKVADTFRSKRRSSAKNRARSKKLPKKSV